MDDCVAVRIWALQRQGFVRPGEVQMGAFVARAGVSVFVWADVTAGDSGWLELDGQRIQLLTSPGTTGGQRWWMACPVTFRRVATVFRHPSGFRFASREAEGLRYRSAYLAKLDQSVLRARRALSRLGGATYDGPPTRDVEAIPRPYRQREATYRRNRVKAIKALRQFDIEMLESYEALLASSIVGR